MQKYRILIIVAITIAAIWLLKYFLGFPAANLEFVNLTLTVSSLIFGLLAGFFITSLWSRYTEIRNLQGERTSAELTMIQFARYFFKSYPKFKQEFIRRVEISAIVDQVIKWDEGHLEIPYFITIDRSFEHIKVKSQKDEVYLSKLMDSYVELNRTMSTMDALYKERLLFSEWLIMVVLSAIINISLLFLDSAFDFYQLLIVVFPPIILMTLNIVYELDSLKWNRELVTIEPAEVVFDALGTARFYNQKDVKFISNKKIKYRTEDDLTGELKQVYLNILKHRQKP